MEIKGYGIEELTEEILCQTGQYVFYIGTDRQRLEQELERLISTEQEQFDFHKLKHQEGEWFLLVSPEYQDGKRIETKETEIAKDLELIFEIYNKILE